MGLSKKQLDGLRQIAKDTEEFGRRIPEGGRPKIDVSPLVKDEHVKGGTPMSQEAMENYRVDI